MDKCSEISLVKKKTRYVHKINEQNEIYFGCLHVDKTANNGIGHFGILIKPRLTMIVW